jgi:hypothetical protein
LENVVDCPDLPRSTSRWHRLDRRARIFQGTDPVRCRGLGCHPLVVPADFPLASLWRLEFHAVRSLSLLFVLYLKSPRASRSSARASLPVLPHQASARRSTVWRELTTLGLCRLTSELSLLPSCFPMVLGHPPRRLGEPKRLCEQLAALGTTRDRR